MPRLPDIVYPIPKPRYLCRIHGNSPCASTCSGKKDQ